MTTPVDPPNANAPAAGGRPSVVVLFARFWAANMDRIHARGSSWPGFGYTPDEQADLHRLAAAVPDLEFVATMAVAVTLTLVAAAAAVGVAFWHLDSRYGADPAQTPAAGFFLPLALAAAATLAVGLPAALLAAAWVSGRAFRPAVAGLPDARLARHVFAKAVRQLARAGVVVSGACLAGWLFAPANAKRDLLLHVVLPTLAPIVSVLTAAYYFARRPPPDDGG